MSGGGGIKVLANGDADDEIQTKEEDNEEVDMKNIQVEIESMKEEPNV